MLIAMQVQIRAKFLAFMEASNLVDRELARVGYNAEETFTGF
jgi:hypothetical protein